jgi:hypothetical protein
MLLAVPVNPSDLSASAIETRISESDLVYIATAEPESDDEHAYDARKSAYNRSWDDIDFESTLEHRREKGLIRRKSGRGSVGIRRSSVTRRASISRNSHGHLGVAFVRELYPGRASRGGSCRWVYPIRTRFEERRHGNTRNWQDLG